jgi:hypothetical protein
MLPFRYLSPKEYEALDLDQKVAYIEAASEHLRAQKVRPQQQQQQQQPQPAQDPEPSAPEKGESKE